MNYLLYFFAGLIVATIGTYHIKNVSRGNRLRSALSSSVSLFVFFGVIVDVTSNMNGMYGILAYVVGDFIGVYATMQRP